MKLILISVLLSSIFYSCRNNESIDAKYLPIKETKIHLDSLCPYNPFKKSEKGEFDYTIISYHNVSCPPCIEEINKWKQLAELKTKKRFQVSLVCHSDDYFEYFKYLCGNGTIKGFPYPFLLDTLNRFLKTNPIFAELNADNTITVDQTDKVILIGNPVHSQEVNKFLNKLLN